MYNDSVYVKELIDKLGLTTLSIARETNRTKENWEFEMLIRLAESQILKLKAHFEIK